MTLTPRPLTPSNQFRRFKGPQTTVRPHSVTPAHSDMEPLSHMTATDRTLIHLGRAKNRRKRTGGRMGPRRATWG